MQSFIVFSHLRWDFVFQRPQHLMTRLAQHYRVFFVEEPCTTAATARMDVERSHYPIVHVCRPHTPIREPGFSRRRRFRRCAAARRSARDHGTSTRRVAWFYTPMALPLLQALDAGAVVYDCMDELSAFTNAPPQLLERESASCCSAADVVFTGGPSLYRAKKDRHPNVHCFPSSVDATHFAQAADPRIEHADAGARCRIRGSASSA